MKAVMRADFCFFVIAGLGLAFMMVVTLTDVIMRTFGRPIVGGMELISFSGAVVVGFAIPYTSWTKGHIIVDFLLEKLSPKTVRILQVITRCMGIALFLFAGYNFIIYGLDLLRTREVTASFRIPYYPITFGLALSCFLQSITLFCDLVTTIREDA